VLTFDKSLLLKKHGGRALYKQNGEMIFKLYGTSGHDETARSFSNNHASRPLPEVPAVAVPIPHIHDWMA
jgi:hypothetical protein